MSVAEQAQDAPAADSWVPTLTTAQMADFVSDGFLRFERVVPAELNERVLAQLPAIRTAKYDAILGGPPRTEGPDTGTPMSACYVGTALGEVFALPELRGIVSSFVGPDPTFDHDFIHHVEPRHPVRQHLHTDAIVDSADPTFDIQVFYFPHDVEPGHGGTRYVPGTHLRRTLSTTTARYQHVVGEQTFAGPAGTILVFHHGLWHSGEPNPSDDHRWMYKFRLNPRVPQVRCWDVADFDQVHNDPTDHVFANSRADSVAAALRRRQPWQGEDALRSDMLERIMLWRYLSGDDCFDTDHYLTRLDRPVPRGFGDD